MSTQTPAVYEDAHWPPLLLQAHKRKYISGSRWRLNNEEVTVRQPKREKNTDGKGNKGNEDSFRESHLRIDVFVLGFFSGEIQH